MLIPFHASFDRHGLVFAPQCRRIDATTAHQLEAQFAILLERYRALRPPRVVYDLTRVKRLDARGVRCLLEARRDTEKTWRVTFAVAAPSRVVRRQIKEWDEVGSLRVWPTLHASRACLPPPCADATATYRAVLLNDSTEDAEASIRESPRHGVPLARLALVTAPA